MEKNIQDIMEKNSENVKSDTDTTDTDTDEYRMVVALRSDLKMKRLEAVIQGSHATVSCSVNALKEWPVLFDRWWNAGSSKTVLEASLDCLVKLYALAKEKRIPCSIVRDAGIVTAVAVLSYSEAVKMMTEALCKKTSGKENFMSGSNLENEKVVCGGCGKKFQKHIIKEGARYHTLSWDWDGTHCSNANCIVNHKCGHNKDLKNSKGNKEKREQ